MYIHNGLGDLLTEPSLPLTPENLRQQWSRNPYNAAVAAYTALQDQREAIWNERIAANGGVYPGGTAAQLLVLAPELAAAQAVVQAYEARIRAIEAAWAALSPTDLASTQLRDRFEGWFEQIFKPVFSSTMGATTNETTLRQEMASALGFPSAWADEVIAWVRSSPVSWKLAAGSDPFPVPGATSITYPGGVVVTPQPGQLAPSVSTPVAVSAPVAPPGSVVQLPPAGSGQEATVQLPGSTTFIPVSQVPAQVFDSANYGGAPPGIVLDAAGNEVGKAGFGLLLGLGLLGAVLVMSGKQGRNQGLR